MFLGFEHNLLTMIKKVIFNEWFDICMMAILLMWLAPWGSFDVTNVGFYISIIVAILSIKTTRHFLKKYQKTTWEK